MLLGTNAGGFVPAPRCPLSRHGPELGDLGGWKCWKGGAGGDEKGASSCWVFLPRPLSLARVAGRAPLHVPGARAMGRTGRAACVPSAPRFWSSKAAGKSSKRLLASCHPAIFQGQRKSSARGAGHYVKWLGLFQSRTDTSSPPEPGEDAALAEVLCQPRGAGQPLAPFCNRLWRDVCLQGQDRARGGRLICFNVWL